MIRAYDIEIDNVRKLSFKIDRHDIAGFYNIDKKQENEITDLLLGIQKPRNGKIELPKLKSIEISEDTINAYCNITVWQYLKIKYNNRINEKYIIEGVLILAELLQYKDCIINNLSQKEKYRLQVSGSLLQHIDLMILHNLFQDNWDNIMECLLEEASLQCGIVVFTGDKKESMHGLPIHYYDLDVSKH